MDAHRCDETRVVHLNAGDGIVDDDLAPGLMGGLAVDEKVEEELNLPGVPICFEDGEAKPVLFSGPGTDVPKLG